MAEAEERKTKKLRSTISTKKGKKNSFNKI